MLPAGVATEDTVEALASRRAAVGVDARAIIFSTITAALLQRPRVPYAVRFDTVAALSRPGLGGVWQRRREPRVLARARVLLPWSETAARTAERLVAGTGITPGPAVITLPVPIEQLHGAAERDLAERLSVSRVTLRAKLRSLNLAVERTVARLPPSFLAAV